MKHWKVNGFDMQVNGFVEAGDIWYYCILLDNQIFSTQVLCNLRIDGPLSDNDMKFDENNLPSKPSISRSNTVITNAMCWIKVSKNLPSTLVMKVLGHQ